jgi:lipid II:glycine glycyltransferase (peptidoglycan interpeptide bridge formation enzyme)
VKNWKDFKYRSLWQHSLWADIQRANGRQVWTLEKPGTQALVVKHELPFGLSWLEVPRGPLFKDEAAFEEIMTAIRELGTEQKSVFIRFSSYQDITAEKLVPTSLDHHPETSLVIDLKLSEDDILAQMKPKGRYNIKVAEKHDVKVEPSDDIEAFYNLLSTTANRDGFGIHPKEYYSNMLDGLGQSGQLLLARYEDRVIAGGLFVYLDEWGIYYYGASDHHYRNVMAPYLIQWQAILEAKKRGCQYYDFLGIAPEGAKRHAWAGVTEFKRKFGGHTVQYPQAWDLVLRPFWYFLYHLAKKK